MITTRRTGAYWFLCTLWDYYCEGLERPIHSSAGMFLFQGAIVSEAVLLPVLRSLYAMHLRDSRRQQRVRTIARINAGFVHVAHNPGEMWRYWAWPELCRARALLRNSGKEKHLTAEQFLIGLSSLFTNHNNNESHYRL